MENTSNAVAPVVRRKPLDNPSRPKPMPPHGIADQLTAVRTALPVNLVPARRSPFPLLDAVKALDAQRGTDLARELAIIGALIHPWADERRTAEYLLRNRNRLRTSDALVAAARCAAEMDVRRARQREMPVPGDDACLQAHADPAGARSADPSVAEIVIAKLRAATGLALANDITRQRISDGVVAAMELGERHLLNGGQAPSVIAMRANARVESRLVTYLRREFENGVAARRIARLLVGSEDAPLDAAFLWWSAQPAAAMAEVPPAMRARWIRDVEVAERALTRPARENHVKTTIRSGVSPQSGQTRSLSSAVCSSVGAHV